MCEGVKLFLILPAIITFNISAATFTKIHMVKIIRRSPNPYSAEKAVAFISQKINTLGFNVFIKKPENAIFEKSLFDNDGTTAGSVDSSFAFLKKI